MKDDSLQSASRRALAGTIAGLAALPIASLAQTPAAPAEWTVLVYINGKNNLEPDALSNFHAMAEVGSTKDVNIIAELGRPSVQRYTQADGNWSGVLRFKVEKGTDPVPEFALQDVGKLGESTDMGKPAALSSFIRWGKKTFPAKRYMLVIWNHGQGWRFMLANSRALPAVAALKSNRVAVSKAPSPIIGGFKAVSSDDDTGSILYNRQVQDVLAQEFSSTKLDLLGYDACLMAMLETAYGVEPYARAMVASEELEPSEGWSYHIWLKKLVERPTMTGEELGAAVVDSYAESYGNRQLTTLSVIRLEGVRAASKILSELADAIRARGPEALSAMRSAREKLSPYGVAATPPLKISIDLITLLEFFEEKTTSAPLKAQSAEVRKAMSALILKNYASTRSSSPKNEPTYGSKGLAIYYPKTKDDFIKDVWGDGYKKNNTHFPVEFVQKERWAELLYKLIVV